ncbi:MAG: alpha-hydroxy-acid oxidizing protein [Alphaproteobacteria bacterium]|nr:alpha-hydroxy-acid oxidizing protein [Alphaproteobacteria bacterium]
MRKLTRSHMQLKVNQTFSPNNPSLDSILDIREFEYYAQNKLPESITTFFSRGAGHEVTLKENVSAFDRIKLLPRVLRNVAKRSLLTTVLNQPVDFPLLVSPMAFQRLAHPEGEVAVAKAAQAHNIIMAVSTLSTYSLEEITANTKIPPWFQLYIYKDREITKNLVQLAEASGYQGIVLTVDTPIYGKRIKELRTPLTLPPEFEIKNLIAAGLPLKDVSSSKLAGYLASLLDPSLSWNDITWLQSLTPLPIILKGIMNPKDMQIAIANSVEAVIISNHGGRQLDTTLSSIEVLKLMKGLGDGKIEIILDGGIRKGIDILKALALGARAVMVGRPILWGLAVGGEEGVKRVLTILKAELDLAMALCGYSSLHQINEEVLHFPDKYP